MIWSLWKRFILVSYFLFSSLSYASIYYETITLDDERDIVELSYPKFQEDWINEIIESPILQWFEALVKQEFNDEIPWFYGKNIEILWQSNSILVLKETYEEYIGGDNGLYEQKFINLDLNKKSEINLNDLLSEAELKLITSIGEKYFRKVSFLGEEDDFGEKGFILPNGFILAKEYAFSEEGLLFLYNAYEIAPHAFGIIEFTIPYEEFLSIVSSDSALHLLANKR